MNQAPTLLPSANSRARIVQASLSTGWGGLEMVLCDFHQWLRKNGIEGKIVCLEGSPLEEESHRRGFSQDLHVVPKGLKREWQGRRILRDLDSADTAFLFHRQQGAKVLTFQNFRSRKSVLCHTFYNVTKKDLWHRFVFSKVDQWVVLTERQKLNLLDTISVAEQKISVIPNGVNLNLFRPLSKGPSAGLHIGVISRLDPQKGQDIAIKALAQLNSKMREPLHLHFFGNNTPDQAPYQPELSRLAQESGVAAFVHFEGYSEEVEKLIPQMDLIWMPSLQETFGRCIVEAMACRIPVIASNAGGVPDIIEHGKSGLLFESGNPEDLANQTERLINDEHLYRTLQDKSFKEVQEKYDAEKIWPRLLNTILPREI